MAKLGMFNMITLDGYFAGLNGDISWHNFGEDEQKMSDELSNSGNTLLFGRITYELMVGYWTSESAKKDDPITTKGMNESRKIVFSRSLKSANWQNTTLLNGNLVSEVQLLKKQEAKDMMILGSGQIVSQLAQANLIDDYVFLINPLVLSRGTSLFNGLTNKLKLKLKATRSMKSGNVLLTYSI